VSARHAVIGSAAGLISVLTVASILAPPDRRLVFNTTASAPLGVYWISRSPPAIGDLALVSPPPGVADWLAQRGYLPSNVPLIKRLAAVGGQHVCARANTILIGGQPVARVLDRDRQGRPLPVWRGCRRLLADEVLLLNDGPFSLDGRYFGPLRRSSMHGRAHALWTWGPP
jgi:conjugative transfer signal peptidase TraF